MIIKRGVLFITIALLMLFPWHVFGAPSKNGTQKNKATVSKKTTDKKVTSSKSKSKKSKSSIRVQKKRTNNKVSKRSSKQIAKENPVKPKDAPPLIKITPLENGKFLLEPMESSSMLNQGTESLSLIKKPVFEEESKEKSSRETPDGSSLSFPKLLVALSKQLLGTTYRLGGNGFEGIDCSGFVKRIYQSLTLSLPHSSREQAKLGSLVTTEWDLTRLKIGDLLFFKRNRGSQISHTGIYIGEGKMIHSASKKGVIISNLKGSDYYDRNFVMAKRLFILDDPEVDEFKEFKGIENRETPSLSQMP